MLWLIVQFVALAAWIVVAGTFLTKSADTRGERAGLGRTLAGMVLLATATSLLELAVDCSAALLHAPDLAAGDVLGSCLFNLLILAVLDMMYRSRGRMLSRGAAAHAIWAVTCVLLTAVVLMAILVNLPWEAWPLGAGSLVVAFVYFACLRLIYFDQQYQQQRDESQNRLQEVHAAAEGSLRYYVGMYLFSMAAILIAAPFLAGTADELAVQTGAGTDFRWNATRGIVDLAT